MQSPDFIFYLFLVISAVFGGLAVWSRNQHLKERELRQSSQPR